MLHRIGIDIGGTFTDVVDINESTGKVRTRKILTSYDPIRGTIGIIKNLGTRAECVSALMHGTTLATNALLERKGAEVGLITTKGFKDVIFIQRMNRKHHYDLQWDKPVPLVKRENCAEVSERVNYKGEILEELDEEEVRQVILEFKRKNIESIAVVFLFSYVNPINELKMKKIIENLYPEVAISLSHEVYPRWREYERTSSTVADAFLKPLISHYTKDLAQILDEYGLGKFHDKFLIMKSNGGVMNYRVSIKRPIDLIMSGPVGGVLSSMYFGRIIQRNSLITMDMGGTSFDVSIINKGTIGHSSEFELEWGMPIRTSMIDVKSIGAGGGSIAWIDKGGLLRVGPQSAGAKPGPVCYGKDGKEPTVTDANLLLGRLNPHYFAGGQMKLNFDACKTSLRKLGSKLHIDEFEIAQVILEVIDSNMMNAIRLVSIDKGVDPRDFTLVAFGGAGPLHATSLASAIGISEIIVPVYPGVFSALGLTTANMRVDQSQTANMRSDNLNLRKVNNILGDLRKRVVKEIKTEGYSKQPSILYEMEMRYLGQNYEINVQIPLNEKCLLTEESLSESYDRFHKLHESLYGYCMESEIIEFINFKVAAIGQIQKPTMRTLPVKDKNLEPKELRQVYFKEKNGFVKTPIYERHDLGAKSKISGPAIIEEENSTTVLFPEQTLKVDEYGNFIINIE